MSAAPSGPPTPWPCRPPCRRPTRGARRGTSPAPPRRRRAPAARPRAGTRAWPGGVGDARPAALPPAPGRAVGPRGRERAARAQAPGPVGVGRRRRARRPPRALRGRRRARRPCVAEAGHEPLRRYRPVARGCRAEPAALGVEGGRAAPPAPEDVPLAAGHAPRVARLPGRHPPTRREAAILAQVLSPLPEWPASMPCPRCGKDIPATSCRTGIHRSTRWDALPATSLIFGVSFGVVRNLAGNYGLLLVGCSCRRYANA